MQLLIYSWTELYAKVQERRAVAKISGRWHCWFPRNNLLLFLRILIKIVAKCSLCHALDICMRGIVYFNKNSKRSSSANYCFRCTRGAKGAKGHTKRKTTNDFCKKPGDWKICKKNERFVQAEISSCDRSPKAWVHAYCEWSIKAACVLRGKPSSASRGLDELQKIITKEAAC